MIIKNSGESLGLVLAHFGKTQRDLARMCGYSVPFVSRALHGKQPLTQAARVRLTQGLKDLITPDNIL